MVKAYFAHEAKTRKKRDDEVVTYQTPDERKVCLRKQLASMRPAFIKGRKKFYEVQLKAKSFGGSTFERGINVMVEDEDESGKDVYWS